VDALGQGSSSGSCAASRPAARSRAWRAPRPRRAPKSCPRVISGASDCSRRTARWSNEMSAASPHAARGLLGHRASMPPSASSVTDSVLISTRSWPGAQEARPRRRWDRSRRSASEPVGVAGGNRPDLARVIRARRRGRWWSGRGWVVEDDHVAVRGELNVELDELAPTSRAPANEARCSPDGARVARWAITRVRGQATSCA